MSYKTKWTMMIPLLVYMLATSFSSFAYEAKQLETKVSINLEDATLVQIFSNLSQQTNFKFSYGEFVLNNTNTYKANYRNKTLKVILEGIGSKALFEYVLTEENIVINPLCILNNVNFNVVNISIKNKFIDVLNSSQSCYFG